MSAGPIRLLIVDDHPVVREGIAGMFSDETRFEIVAQAGDGAAAVELARRFAPDVILMDLRMPQMDGLSAARRILADQPDARIIVLTSHDRDEDIQTALKAGVVGYLLKDSPRDVLYEAVESAMRGETTLSPGVYQQMVAAIRAPQDALTERELDVLTLAAHGLTSKAIGGRLHISTATVKTHLRHIYAKLNAPDRAAAVAIAIKRGLIDV